MSSFMIGINNQSMYHSDIRPELAALNKKIDSVLLLGDKSAIGLAVSALQQLSRIEKSLELGTLGWTGEDADACLAKLKELHGTLRQLRDGLLVSGNAISRALIDEIESPQARMEF